MSTPSLYALDGKLLVKDNQLSIEKSCCLCCNEQESCPVRGEVCEDFYPASPYVCCSGQCKECPCWPGALTTFTLLKKTDEGCCSASGSLSTNYYRCDYFDNDTIPAGEQFDFLIGGFSNCSCDDLGGYSQMYLGWWSFNGCDVIQGSFIPAGALECYEVLSYSSCRWTCSIINYNAAEPGANPSC